MGSNSLLFIFFLSQWPAHRIHLSSPGLLIRVILYINFVNNELSLVQCPLISPLLCSIITHSFTRFRFPRLGPRGPSPAAPPKVISAPPKVISAPPKIVYSAAPVLNKKPEVIIVKISMTMTMIVEMTMTDDDCRDDNDRR